MATSEAVKGKQLSVTIISNRELTPENPDHFQLVFHSDFIASNASPGQFIHFAPPENSEMLRRPLSIHNVNQVTGEISVIYRVIGEGTKLLSTGKDGDSLDIIGPLGNGFPLITDHPAIIAGGGVGIPPLVFLAKTLLDKGLSIDHNHPLSLNVFLGSRDRETLLCVEDFKELGIEPVIATEDGSIGIKGYVTYAMDLLPFLDKDSIVYSCGPVPMLEAVHDWSANRGFRCYTSLENKMGCGIGACLGCSIPVKDSEDTKYERVCIEGPTFDSSHVDFNQMK